MKKKLSLVAALTLTASMFSAVAASAATPNAYYSDVDAFINNYPIQSYTINNHSVVSTSDIKSFGFKVDWDENARAVYISKDPGAWAWNPTANQAFVRNYEAYKGDVAFATVPTDIKVYVNATPVASYNSGTNTYINLADLVYATCKHSTISKQYFAQDKQTFLWVSSHASLPAPAAVPTAWLKATKAYEIAVKTLDNSIYRKADKVFKKTARVVGLPYIYTDTDLADANGGYTFAVDFGSDAVNASIHVNKDGSAYFVNVPQWLTYMCD
ncbi:MAG: hypothetical protein PUD92_00340 [Clostridiales bacterium]|nr:hypothetical protein [Clostridiales bacterium]